MEVSHNKIDLEKQSKYLEQGKVQPGLEQCLDVPPNDLPYMSPLQCGQEH